jgi:hypothetical protein
MNYTLHAGKVVAKRRIYETLITPGFYIAASFGLITGHLLISGFTRCVDTGGINFALSPVYSRLTELLSGLFGVSFVEKLFSKGPFPFAFLSALLPVFFYLPFSSAYQFGFEKSVGALELIVYGPARSLSIALAFFLKDLIFLVTYSGFLILFFSVSALIHNLTLDVIFFHSVVTTFFLALGVYSYNILSVALTKHAASSLATFFGFILLFSIVAIGNLAVTGEYVRNLSRVFSWIVQWFSPVFYWVMGLQAAEYGNLSIQLLSSGALVVLSASLILLSHIAFSTRGVRV